MIKFTTIMTKTLILLVTLCCFAGCTKKHVQEKCTFQTNTSGALAVIYYKSEVVTKTPITTDNMSQVTFDLPEGRDCKDYIVTGNFHPDGILIP
jgi:L-asparaginase/Glu-tRNA(Gln) amidotransferase subunit D